MYIEIKKRRNLMDIKEYKISYQRSKKINYQGYLNKYKSCYLSNILEYYNDYIVVIF